MNYYIIWSGLFYTDGCPKIVFSTEELAKIYLINLGYKKIRGEKNLFEIVIDSTSFWARIDKISFGG
jgi:hypothetical protein